MLSCCSMLAINNKLPPDLSNMFQYSYTLHNYNTRNVSNQGFYIPSINTTTFGNKSLVTL